MPRIDIELTSSRPDGTWTWRAAGARQPKGTLDASLLFPGAKVGDVVRADCEIDLDGTRVTALFPPRAKRPEPDRLSIIGSGRQELPVTHDGGPPVERARRDGDRRPAGDRREGRDRPDRRQPRRDARPSARSEGAPDERDRVRPRPRPEAGEDRSAPDRRQERPSRERAPRDRGPRDRADQGRRPRSDAPAPPPS
ncbi:MAG TPA: hypothetical protein VHG90_01510, partial [Acidimicrobiales bacterium]|nr:hypothetical protein [Acidimicrobiales bacterium]